MVNNINNEGLLKVGTLLANGKYRIDQYLASGGFGNTYVATDMAFTEKVAIKELFIKGVCGRNFNSTEISISLTENKRAFSAQQEKFRKEARRIRKLNNPHIVGVHDLFDENGTSYYVMDFVEGESLSTRMKRTKKPLDEKEMMLILNQILDALACVHAEGIWHLDLKPANIMVDKNGNVQLIDFGASKQLKNTNGESLSTSSAMAYTTGFASSEQMEQNFDKFGPWTDLYSLGATIYNLLTMQQPPSPSDIDEDPLSALSLPVTITKNTKDLVIWMMRPNRKMRPQSVGEVQQYLLNPRSMFLPETQGDTIIIHNKPSTHTTQTKDTKKPRHIFRKVLLSIAGTFAFLFFVGEYMGNTESASEGQLPMKKVENLMITIATGPKNMRQYTYTGELVDTLGALPNGKGIAQYSNDGATPGFTYTGGFINGVCEDSTGTATVEFANGDKFIGTFVSGYWGEGKYIVSDGSYFVGTFKDNKPDKGQWYNSKDQPKEKSNPSVSKNKPTSRSNGRASRTSATTQSEVFVVPKIVDDDKVDHAKEIKTDAQIKR